MLITPPDIAISIILFFFAFNGFRHGFIEEIGKIISLICGFIFASKFHQLLMPYIVNYIETETLQVTLAYLIIFIITIIIISIIIKILQKFIELVFLGWLNRLLGLSLGLLKGFLLISLFIFILQAIPLKVNGEETIRQKFEKESIMYQICNQVKELIILTIPMEKQLKIIDDGMKKISNTN
ncbi:MAG: CvpA family protein [Candidatus Neomarinimicrobiota bacterium]|nr:CvpA family protein [Candidatus Neomarinimicrobiota bacterium]|tara:strand:- start:918 stop:1463 length:546 start_codon:yes stop_codon:yes gene_type:complete